jgi:hypothetical protein
LVEVAVELLSPEEVEVDTPEVVVRGEVLNLHLMEVVVVVHM